MSKSSESPKGSISLLDTRDVIRDKIRSAVTDSGCEVRVSPDRPAISNLLTIDSLVVGTVYPRPGGPPGIPFSNRAGRL